MHGTIGACRQASFIGRLIVEAGAVNDTRSGRHFGEILVEPNDGFEISEVDLKLRGPGDMMGTQQSGVLNLRIANIVQDTEVLKIARSAAIQVLKDDPTLQKPYNCF